MERSEETMSAAVDPETARETAGGVVGPGAGAGELKPKKARRRAHTKTSRACNHCHKAHMTCDTSRPCKRCVARDLADSCVDAPRKKKKYLMDVPDMTARSESQQQQWSSVPLQFQDSTSSAKDDTAINQSMESNSANPPADGPESYPSPLTHFQYGPSQRQSLPSINSFRKTPFLSDAADLEYAVLGNIVNDPYSPSLSPGNNYVSPDEHFTGRTSHTPPPGFAAAPSYKIPALPPQPKPQFEKRRSTTTATTPCTTTNSNGDRTPSLYSQSGETAKYDTAVNQYFIGPVHGPNEEISKTVNFPDIIDVIAENERNNPKSFFNNKTASISFSIGLTSEDEYNRKVVDQDNIAARNAGLRFKEPSEIYSKVLRPFSYYPGYHQLLSYLNSRFNKTQIVSMAKTMAEYRPSFIAATCNLKEDDLIFMEQCFQRTLLEYDNYISISGTPTIVWRRTGQIAYVGNEFCTLTGWSKESLLDKITLIVELLDDDSVLEYFKLFNKIAFADFTGASMSECTMISPRRQKIRCRCQITLKRDVFGIPMMIIGNFLPILGDYGTVEE